MDKPDREGAGARSLRRGIAMLGLIRRRGRPMSVTELVATLGVPKSTAYEIVRVLVDEGLLTPDATFPGNQFQASTHGDTTDPQFSCQTTLAGQDLPPGGFRDCHRFNEGICEPLVDRLVGRGRGHDRPQVIDEC